MGQPKGGSLVMDWEPHPLKEMETWVLDGIFDRTKGWEIPEEQAPVTRIIARDGNPNYSVMVDDIKDSRLRTTHVARRRQQFGVSRAIVCES